MLVVVVIVVVAGGDGPDSPWPRFNVDLVVDAYALSPALSPSPSPSLPTLLCLDIAKGQEARMACTDMVPLERVWINEGAPGRVGTD